MFDMKRVTALTAAALVAVGLSTAPASAAVLTNNGDIFDVSITTTAPANQGGNFLDTQFVGELISKTLVAGGLVDWAIDLMVYNNSPVGTEESSIGFGPRLTIVGFETTPDILVSGSTGDPWALTSGNFPSGVDVEFCLTAGSGQNCAGGGGGGIIAGESSLLKMVLRTAESDSLSFETFAARYQTLDGGGSWAYVPLPAPLFLLLGGIGGLGLMSRRRKAASA